MNEKQTQALEFAKEGHNIYVGGQAGTGKSFLLREIFSWAKQCGKSVALTATTGVACCLFPEVMLLRNISDKLVNGLCGNVVDVQEGEVTVHFPTLHKNYTITRMNFAVFDPASNRNLAVRNQIPLKLCYAMTIHKAQGMTLDRVEVDCRQMFQPDQLAVAMGRVKSPDGLRVVHFSEDAVIPQSPLVITFLQTESVAVKSNLSCCHYRINEQVNEIKDQLTKDSLNSQPAECDIDILSEFDPETDALLAEIDI